MGIRPLVEIDEETRNEAFEQALSEKDKAEGNVEPGEIIDPEEDDVEVIEGEPPEEEDDKKDTESNSLDKLVDLLSNRTTPEPVVVDAPKRAPLPQINKAEIKKKFNEGFYKTDDPFSMVEESAQALVGGTLAQQSLEIQKLKKEVLKNDPINTMIFNNWESEVETEIAKLPANQQVHPDAYEYALRNVRDKHFNEILEAKIEERTSAKTRPGATVGLGNTRSVANKPKKKSRTVYATARDKSEAKRYGIALKDYLKGQGRL